MSSGELRERVLFQEQAESDSSYGTIAGDWEDRFTVAARIQPLRGSEPVMAQRLAGVQPVIIKVRSSDQSRRITNAWRARDARTGAEYAIRTVTPDEHRKYIDILAESGGGVAT